MPQNGHTGQVHILHGGTAAEGGVQVRQLRGDICLGVVRNGSSGQHVAVRSDTPVLVIAFQVPRLGKGGEDKLPAGSLSLFPPGESPLPDMPGRGLFLGITSPRLKAILGPDANTLPERVRGLLADNKDYAERILVSLTPEQVLAGNTLIQSPYVGAVRNMLDKSKVLELLALFFGQVALQEKAGGKAALTDADRKIIARAREFLIRHMDSPPPLSRIARYAGVNDTKLKRLFKAAYGQSPYAYLRGERLAAARQMLLAGDASVSEAAVTVGYTNVSHFIEAFSRQYGLRPGELRRRRSTARAV